MDSESLARVDNGEADRLLPIVKAHFVGERNGVQSTVLVEQERTAEVFGGAGALQPAYDPNVLTMIYENSSALRPNVDAYIANIDSFGHCYVPTIETSAVDADEKIRDALRVERSIAKLDSRNAQDESVLLAQDEPTDAEVAARKKLLETEIRMERSRLGTFFENCTADMPFSGPEGLRGLTRQDIEVIGNGYWEVLRNGRQEVCQFNHIPAVSVRMMPIDTEVTEVAIERRLSLLTLEKAVVRKRYRRYVQIRGDFSLGRDRNFVYFKEFGDPRVISANTGKAYKDTATFLLAKAEDSSEKDSVPATEILSFKISSPRATYGVPRWIGALLAVLGTRQAEEVNFLYFENRSVPPLAILVSGGRLNENTVARLESYISNEIRGKRNFHKIMILEAEGAENAATGAPTSHMKIELRPLTDAQQKDGNWQQYDERNADKVGQSFRLPRILRGDVRDFNRSTASASIDFAEIQVFGPIRQQFDWVVNKLIFPALGIKYHLFKSNAPTVRDPEQLSRMIALITGANILTPAESRDLAQDVFNRSFDNLTDDWTKKPLAITLAEINLEGKNGQDAFDEAGGNSTGNAGQAQRATGVQQAPAKTTPPDRTKPKPKSTDAVRALGKEDGEVQELILRKAILDAEAAALEDDVERIKVPREIFESWWVKDDAA
jgi:PBSX family phage portal protein